MSGYLAIGLFLGCLVFFVYIYHKVFNVYIFNADGCISHVITCCIGGGIIMFLVVKFWYIAAVVCGVFLYKAIRS